MTINEIKPQFLAMSNEQQARLLSLVAHNLTVCARSQSLPEVEDSRARQKLLGLNELMHQITAHLMHMVYGDLKRYPDDVLMDIILEISKLERCEFHLLQSFEWSLISMQSGQNE